MSTLYYCTLNACDECKATTDCPTKCEIPLNIKHNIGKQPIEILMGNYKYINSHLWSKFKAWLSQGEYAPSSSCDRMKETLKIYLSYWLGFFGLCILFVILVTLDMMSFNSSCSFVLRKSMVCHKRLWKQTVLSDALPCFGTSCHHLFHYLDNNIFQSVARCHCPLYNSCFNLCEVPSRDISYHNHYCSMLACIVGLLQLIYWQIW